MNKLKQRKSVIWIRGEKVDDLTVHPAFRGLTESQAALYDLQNEPSKK
ncbi:4-hydroxyphenylacetate 3-hydroxylase N-terminal domain-containing protein [Ammoniphilus sp. 3BR4]